MGNWKETSRRRASHTSPSGFGADSADSAVTELESLKDPFNSLHNPSPEPAIYLVYVKYPTGPTWSSKF